MDFLVREQWKNRVFCFALGSQKKAASGQFQPPKLDE